MSAPALPPDTQTELCPKDQANITFTVNSSRPPVVPGEETTATQGAGVGAGSQSPIVLGAGWGTKVTHGGSCSPVVTPRRPAVSHHGTLPEGAASLGFEPEGSCSPCGIGELSGAPSSPPSYLRWARNLPSLLEDPDGVDLFRRYLESEGRNHADTLDFWFACEGLRKQTDLEKINQLVKVIYRRFFLKTQLGVGEELRRAVNRKIKEASSGGGELDCRIFDASQQEVERLITETTYPNFLRSDLYLAHVQAMQNGSSSSSGSGSGSSSGSGGSGCAAAGLPTSSSGGMLATVHEDSELTGSTSEAPLPLTRDMLLVTQKRRATELRPKPEAYAGVYLQAHMGKSPHHPYHYGRMPAYSSYNPVSRQDSELQSLSSDARTESDNMSLTDSSVDGMSSSSHHRFTRKQYQRHCRQMKEAANLNRDPYMHHTLIPRTQRIQKEQVHPMEPKQFAAILIEKLENVKRNQEAQEKLDRKLLEGDMESMDSGPKSLADAIREKLQVDDDNDQDILDQHVSRVWSDLTPSRTPGLISPRPKSPDALRRSRMPMNPQFIKVCVSSGGTGLPSQFAPLHPYQARPYPRHPRKEKDVFSTFSSDSGNVHDFPEGSEHRHHIPKSKSMPDYADVQDMHSSMPGHDRFRQSRDGGSRSRWSSKKTELTDSGVSVVSDTPPVSHPSQFKDRVLSWLMESDKQQMCGALSTHSERDSNSSCSIGQGKTHRLRPNISSRGPPSRSASLERGVSNPAPPAPAQPFVADPSMPPLPSPHTATQLEEARRRLMEDEGRSKQSRQRFGVSGKMAVMDTSQSGGSTLRRGGGGRGGSSGRVGGDQALPHPDTYTTVVFSFCDEQFPYRTKIPGRPVTLRQFKEYLPKKGTYRYFFKTECEDLDMRVIQEEIVDDNEILPLWEGKVMAQVKPVE